MGNPIVILVRSVETLPLEPPPLPPLPDPPPPRRRLHVILFAATFVTLTMAGAWFWADTGLTGFGWEMLSPHVLVQGLPYALLVLLILGAHEFGHYFACQYYGVRATLPFFIPGFPMIIGTFGAVIRIRSQIPSRRALFDIAAAGPIAGFAIALPVLAIGVAFAHPIPTTGEPHGVFLGPPLVSWLLERAFHGDANLQVGPIYGAAWVGMLVTSLNLLPVGQLDGGHALFAVSPTLHRVVSWVTIASFAAFIAFEGIFARTVSSYALWLVILLVLRGRHPRLTDELSPLDGSRAAIGWALALMLVLTFIPVPLQVV
jgi:membrane-associated protease RseP (regulator of RpoE activity)